MLVLDTTPLSVPASSPDVRAISVCTVHVFRLRMRTRLEHVEPFACASCAMFGNAGARTGSDGALDFTHGTELAVTIAGVLFAH